MPALSVFIDTNCFLQLRDLKDLPWKQLFPEYDEIDLVIAHIVVDELDEKKNDEKRRRRDRARSGLKLVEQATDADGLVLRDTPFKLTLRVDPGDRVDWASFPRLDPSRADDQLVGAALMAPQPRAVATHDRGPYIRARALGLEAKRIPDDWALPDEATDKDKEIAQLKREVAALSAEFPEIELSFEDWNEETSRIETRAPVLAPLDTSLVDRLTAAVIARNPMLQLAPNRVRGLSLMAGGVSEFQVAEYEGDYAEYAREVRRFFEDLHEKVQNAGGVPRIRYELANATTITAQNLLLRFEVGGEAHLLVDRGSLLSWGGDLSPPAPPEAPRSAWDLESRRIADLTRGMGHPEPRDPTGFYWQDRPSAEEQAASLICAEFRAKETYANHFGVLLMNDLPFEGKLRFEISARNMKETLRRDVAFSVTRSEGAWTDADVLERLEPWIADEIRAASGS